MPSAEPLWLPILAAATVAATMVTLWVRKRWRRHLHLKADVEAAGREMIYQGAMLLRNIDHIAARTEFDVHVQPYSVGFWPWQKRYQAVLVIMVADQEDIGQIDTIFRDVVREYRQTPGNHSYKTTIDFKPLNRRRDDERTRG